MLDPYDYLKEDRLDESKKAHSAYKMLVQARRKYIEAVQDSIAAFYREATEFGRANNIKVKSGIYSQEDDDTSFSFSFDGKSYKVHHRFGYFAEVTQGSNKFVYSGTTDPIDAFWLAYNRFMAK